MSYCAKENGKFGCLVCNIEFGDLKTWEMHSAGRKHQHNLHHAELNRKREENGVFITGFSPRTNSESIRGFLRRFGELTDYYYNEQKKFALATFSEKKVVEELLNCPHGVFLNNAKLKISRRKVNNTKKQEPTTPATRESTLSGVDLKNVLETLNQGGNLGKLLKELAATDKERSNHNIVLADLQAVFQMRFRYVHVHVFGSARTGLNLKGSDIDVFLEIVDGEDPETARINLPPPEKLVRIGQKLMSQYPDKFGNVRAIAKAKTPIIKFVHRLTRISCDVSFKNMLAVANSELIKFYWNLDRRIYPYFMIIKYWAKVHEFSGCGKMSNYALMTIAAFYLQQLNPPVLPTVHCLQKKSVFEQRVDGWRCDFSRCPKDFNSSDNKMTFIELLIGFFTYFKNFKHIGQVICTFDATVLPKRVFTQVNNLPDPIREEYIRGLKERNHGLRVSCDMVVQDPFELTHNLTASMGSKALKSFTAHCILASEIMNKAYKVSEDKVPTLLIDLFTKKPKKEKDPKGTGIRLTKTEMQLTYLAGGTLSVMYLISDELDPPEDSPNELSDDVALGCWVQLVYELLVFFLEKIMKLQVQECQLQESASKVQKVDQPSDVHDPTPVNETSTVGRKMLQANGYYSGCDDRRKVQSSLTLPKNLNCMELEECISDAIVATMKVKKENTKPPINFSCEFIPIKEPSLGAKFIFKDTGSQGKFFGNIMRFMSTKMPCLFTKYLKYLKNASQQSTAKSNDPATTEQPAEASPNPV